MIVIIVSAFIICIGVFGAAKWHENYCERSWVQIDQCKMKYSLESCKGIYLPKSCDDGDYKE